MNTALQIFLPSEGGYTPPSVQDFQFDGPWGPDGPGNGVILNKPMLQMILALILVLVFWLWGSRKMSVVPSRKQFFFEGVYNYIRDGVGREMLGPKLRPYIGLLVGIFTFVLINNWFGEFFLIMFPTFSNIGYTWGIVLFVYLTYIFVGFKTHGIKYLRNSLIPKGVPWYLWVLIIPIEFISNFITRPLTLAVRLFANMFAGHMGLLVFIVGGAFLLTYKDNLFFNISGLLSCVMGILMCALELFLGFLQAYIFTILTAQYISSSVSDSH